ncbi:ABC transporter permease [Tissierellaceae bacterium HCP3S3_D8]
MKNYRELTYRYLKGQRNRTLLTIFGIILSVALISAIGTIIVSARGALIKESIRENGSYHAEFHDIDRRTVDKLANHVGIEEIGITRFEGVSPIVETTEKERKHYGWDMPYRYIYIYGYDNESLEMLPFNLKDGRFPETSNEIVIESWMTDYFKEEVKLGDKINLVIGNRDEEDETFEKTGEREYTVVGFIEPKYFWRGSFITQGITVLDSKTYEDNNYNAYIKISNIKDANEKIASIGDNLGIGEDSIEYNYRLLRLYAESLSKTFNKSLIALLIFVVTLIVISTIAVIYNAFNISVLERISQFGLLRSVGATPNQIRAIVLKEAGILSLIGIPIGLFSGVLAMKIVIYIIGLLDTNFSLVNDMEITISGTVFLISTVVGVMTVFLSAIGPARQAGRVSPLEAIRNTGEIKKESFKKVGNSPLVRKILGVEGEIAYKNLRRNKKRFLITVFSMVISISLFITFSTFSDFTFKMGAMDSAGMGDFNIYGDMQDRSDEIYGELIDIKDVKRVYKVIKDNGEILLEDRQINKKMMEIAPYLFADKKDDLIRLHNAELRIIGDENLEVLKGLLKEGTIDIEELNKNNGVLVINNTNVYDNKTERSILMEGYNFKVGDKIPFGSYRDNRDDEGTKYQDLNVVGVLDKGVLDKLYNYDGDVVIITTEEVYKDIFPEYDSYVNMYIEMKDDGDSENIKTYLEEISTLSPGVYYMDYAEEARNNRALGIVMSIFLYGFVAIITLISAINIINTISTNIILRTREIAMIKAVGMTQSGIKRMVAFESLFYGLYSSLFGGTIGLGLTYILFRIIMGMRGFEYQIPWENAIIACVGATFVALLSGSYPLKRINDKVIVESMKAEN